MKKETLSDKRIKMNFIEPDCYIYYEKDVKEFIEKLKEEFKRIYNPINFGDLLDYCVIKETIDKRAGESLI